MSFRRMNNIKALLEWLGSLQITEEASSDHERMDIEMLTALTLAPTTSNKNVQAEMLKNMVLDPGWFDGDQMKFKDW